MDVSLEHQTWDNVEPVYLEIGRGASQAQRGRLSSTDYVPVAKRTFVTTKEAAASGGVYTTGDLSWSLPAVVLTPGVQPKPGDVVIDSDQVRWTVLAVDRRRWRQRWKLTCRNLTIAYDLRDKIDVQRATLASDSAGAPLKTFPPAGGAVLYRGLTCRVQPLTADVVEERGIRGKETHYDVTVDRQVSVDTEDRIVWNGVILDIVGYRQPELITELPVIEATAKP